MRAARGAGEAGRLALLQLKYPQALVRLQLKYTQVILRLAIPQQADLQPAVSSRSSSQPE